MAAKKAAYYQSRYRARLREKGYVKREIWIPPDYTKVLKNCETALRAGVMPIIPKTVTENKKMSEDGNWTTETSPVNRTGRGEGTGYIRETAISNMRVIVRSYIFGLILVFNLVFSYGNAWATCAAINRTRQP